MCSNKNLLTVDNFREEVLNLIPQQVRAHQNQGKWRDLTHNQFTSIQTQTAHQARGEVLAMLSNRKMCGGSFFNVEVWINLVDTEINFC